MTGSPRFALCGGTFDPIHRGHVEPVMSVFQRAGWSRVIFIPAWQQPFKTDRQPASSYHRFAMAVLATEADPRIEVSPIELERGRVSYTVETLEAFRQQNPDTVLDWVIGDDNLEELDGWRSIDRIFELANFVVLNRGGSSNPPARMKARVQPLEDRPRSGAILFLGNEIVPISATDLRIHLVAGEDVRGLIHPRVEQYIRKNHLYESPVPAQTRWV